MTKTQIIQYIVNKFSQLDYVESIVLSGSQTNLIHDQNSDYDIYIYSIKPIPVELRTEIAKSLAFKFEVGNSFFEDGDELIINENNTNDFCIDIMYRNPQWVENEIDWIWRKHNAKVGYTTCFLHNVRTSKILFDRNKKFQQFIDELNEKFPKKLMENIIAKNYPLLMKKNASYYDQIKLAITRKDIVSINHRITAFLASYFDIIFAINGQTHPGEKKLIAYTQELCSILPNNFQENIEKIIKPTNNTDILLNLKNIMVELDTILEK